jgi:hypothetical protein
VIDKIQRNDKIRVKLTTYGVYKFMNGIIIIIIYVGSALLIGLLGEIMGGVAAFREETFLGAIYLLVPLAEIVICLMLWEKYGLARQGLLLMIVSFLMFVFALVFFLGTLRIG